MKRVWYSVFTAVVSLGVAQSGFANPALRSGLEVSKGLTEAVQGARSFAEVAQGIRNLESAGIAAEWVAPARAFADKLDVLAGTAAAFSATDAAHLEEYFSTLISPEQLNWDEVVAAFGQGVEFASAPEADAVVNFSQVTEAVFFSDVRTLDELEWQVADEAATDIIDCPIGKPKTCEKVQDVLKKVYLDLNDGIAKGSVIAHDLLVESLVNAHKIAFSKTFGFNLDGMVAEGKQFVGFILKGGKVHLKRLEELIGLGKFEEMQNCVTSGKTS